MQSWIGLRRAPAAFAAAVLLWTAAAPLSAAAELTLSTLEEFGAEFGSVPCRGGDRQQAARALLERVGAPPGGVAAQQFKGTVNWVIRGGAPAGETVVVGAHYDKVARGCGAVDNWTGVVALAHLVRTLRSAQTRKSLLFVAFGDEEKGMVGSQRMVREIPDGEVGRYCAMVNIDSLGLGAPQVLENISSPKLTAMAARLAGEMGIPFGSGAVRWASSDSSSFLERGIPALTLHGLSGGLLSVIHTDQDQVERVKPESVFLGYRLVLAMLLQIDREPCGAYR